MESNKDEIIEKLMKLDNDVALIDDTDEVYSCVIVGGSALVLTDRICRSTMDIDSIQSSDKIKPLFDAYNINMNVRAYALCFPGGYEERLQAVDIPTKKVKFYTVSLEDLVVSKLCSNRSKDIEDIENESVYKNVD